MWTFLTRYRFSGSSVKAKTPTGFTLVELVVVIGIISILSTVFIFQQRRFDSSTLLRSLAYSIALSIRQAQVYSTSVRQFGTTADSFNYSYGVYFDTSDLSHYYLFGDAPPSYDRQRESDGSEDVQRFSIGSGYTILKFCATPSIGGPAECSDSATSPLTWLVVYFKRPNPDACFATSNDISACTSIASTYSDAYIQIQGPSGGAGDTRSIIITATGQISVGAFGS